MLKSLVIKNITLLEDVQVSFAEGLCIITGETGSGKSVLLEALLLALGVRSSSRLLREGKSSGSVTAIFDISCNENCQNLLRTTGLEVEEELILRRVLTEDGKSKAFINDVVVGQGLLNAIGRELVEIHGQHDQGDLRWSFLQRNLLDQYGNLGKQQKHVQQVYEKLQDIRRQLQQQDDDNSSVEYWKQVLEECHRLNIQPGEEGELLQRRTALQRRENIITILKTVRSFVDDHNSLFRSLASAQHYLSRHRTEGENLLIAGKNAFDAIGDDLERGEQELKEGLNKIDLLLEDMTSSDRILDEVEERLHLIRSFCRKYQLLSENFTLFQETAIQKLKKEQQRYMLLDQLQKQQTFYADEYLLESHRLRELRQLTAVRLEKAMVEELATLQLADASFKVNFEKLPENDWGSDGIDRIKFMMATNGSHQLEDIAKIASGGELSRFMLALKVVLANLKSVTTVIFDEIDTGIGGFIAEIVGERLKKLGQQLQVLVVTHLPQVASKGSHHLRVIKKMMSGYPYTLVEKLDEIGRREEIAKMLSGETVTEEALMAASKLLQS